MKQISIIVAIAENNAIGKDNQLLWHLPDDLKWFKKNTTGCDVVMGKNTFYSLPLRPLPKRRNIVISDNPKDQIEGCIMAYSIEDAIDKMEDGKENFVIGGGSVYRQFLPHAQKLYITKVLQRFEADTFFPEIDAKVWKLTSSESHPKDEKHPFAFAFQIYERM
jgi:dihydrofolate reductase